MSNPQSIPHHGHRTSAAQSNIFGALSPPSKNELKSWRKWFGRKTNEEDENAIVHNGIFGVPLSESIRYANVAISFSDGVGGESQLYGYVPIVVAKCGVFLKEQAVDVEGIFRLSGSAKRIKDLQTAFDSPDKYGKGLDWTGYTVHDAANVLRRYLNQLPEPIVPLDYYERFREPLRTYQAKVSTERQAQGMETQEHGRVVTEYQQLITEVPALNRQLLLYILDLLAVFASKSDVNRMTAQNLAAIFQPGILSHPKHDMTPKEYLLSQDVLIFLIENQDNFLFGMPGTAMDTAAQNAVRSSPTQIPKVNKTAAIGRSASNASAGADSLRRLRRNQSTSSRGSKHRNSPGITTPGTPGSPVPNTDGTRSVSGGLTRSNTVPSNHSPALGSGRFQQRAQDNLTETTMVPQPPIIPVSAESKDISQDNQKDLQTVANPGHSRPVQVTETAQIHESRLMPPSQLQDNKLLTDQTLENTDSLRPTRDRKFSDLLQKSPLFGPSDPQRPQRKLQKRRIPGSVNESAQSSQASFQAADDATLHGQSLRTPSNLHDQANPLDENTVTSLDAPAVKDTPQQVSSPHRGLMPPAPNSPAHSNHSRASLTDPSDLEGLEDPQRRDERRKHRFKLSSLGHSDEPLRPPPVIGRLPAARSSGSSIGSQKPRKSFTGDSQQTQATELSSGARKTSSGDSNDAQRIQDEDKKGGFLSRMKAKLTQSKDERERAKSPPRAQQSESGSRASLSAFAHEHFNARGRSMDKQREGVSQVGREQAGSGPSLEGQTVVQPYPVTTNIDSEAVPRSATPQIPTAVQSSIGSAPTETLPAQLMPTGTTVNSPLSNGAIEGTRSAPVLVAELPAATPPPVTLPSQPTPLATGSTSAQT